MSDNSTLTIRKAFERIATEMLKKFEGLSIG